MRLTRRLALVIVAAMLPMLAVELFNAYALVKGEQDKSRALAVQYARAASWELQRVLSGAQGVLTTIRHAPSIVGASWERCPAFMTSLKPQLPELRSISVAGADGNVLCSSENANGINIADRPYFQQALAGQEFVVGHFTIGRLSDKPTMPLASPVVDGSGRIIAVVVATLELDWLSKTLLERGIPPGGSITVADADGVIVARQPFPDRFIGTKIPANYAYLLREPNIGALEVMSQDGTPRVLGYKPVATAPAGLYVSAGLSVDEAYAGVYAAGYRLLAASAIAVLCAILLSGYISGHFVARPVGRLIDAAERWRAGDLKARSNLRDGDEFGTISMVLDRAMDEAERREQRISLLMNELSHRVKNQMALIISIAQLSGKDAGGIDEFKRGFFSRMIAMSRSHDLVFNLKEERALLSDLIRTQLEHLTITDKVGASGPTVWLAPEATQYVGMALHELATNAVKYGALSVPAGRIAVSWTITGTADAPQLDLRWQEMDGPPVTPPARRGFGNTVLTSAVPSALQGEATLSFEPAGLVWNCRITAHISIAAAEAA